MCSSEEDELVSKGTRLASAGRFRESVVCLEKALAGRPDHPVALVAMASSLSRMGYFQAAIARCEQAIGANPLNADAWFIRGSVLYMTGRWTEAVPCLDQATSIDPGHTAARVGLSQFYLGAPGIAGGSVEKAKAQGNALLAIPGKRGEYQGHMVLANIAVHDEDWAEMTRQLTAAETAEGDGADPVGALRSHAWYLLNKKKDAQAALPIVERYVKAAPADDVTAWFLDGEVKRELGRCADALPRYDQVLAKRAEARGSRWGAAVCREQLGQKDAAGRYYEEYARRFPDDVRAKEAKAAIKRLAGS